jgi:hypothetical protein
MYKSDVVKNFRPMSTIERFNVRDTSGAMGINEMLKANGGVLDIEMVKNYITCEVHNDAILRGDKDYINHFLVTEDGEMYYTSSDTLAQDIDAICELVSDCEAESGKNVEAFSIRVKEYPSKNNQQGFMKASLKAIIYEGGEIES